MLIGGGGIVVDVIGEEYDGAEAEKPGEVDGDFDEAANGGEGVVVEEVGDKEEGDKDLDEYEPVDHGVFNYN